MVRSLTDARARVQNDNDIGACQYYFAAMQKCRSAAAGQDYKRTRHTGSVAVFVVSL